MITGVVLARDEERNIANCLESFRPHVAELILIDMESSDRTVELARAYSIKVLSHPKVANFDVARNIAIPAARFENNSKVSGTDIIGSSDTLNRPPIEEFFAEARKRTGVGPWKFSAQHCWAACWVSAVLGPGLGTLTAIGADFAELGRAWGDDSVRDILSLNITVRVPPLASIHLPHARHLAFVILRVAQGAFGKYPFEHTDTYSNGE